MPGYNVIHLLENLKYVPWSQTFLLAFAVSMLLVTLSSNAARQFGVLARPSERGSHQEPTPRLGGLGVAFSFYFVLLSFYLWFPFAASPWSSALIVGGAYALVGGLLDDVMELDPKWKFLFQFAAAGAAILFGFSPKGFLLPNNEYFHFSPLAADLMTFLFLVFLMNAYNFMDGMDGQAALFGIIVTMGICLPLAVYRLLHNTLEVLITASLAGAILGLFIFNLPWTNPEKKTFMGDCGSQFIGFMLGLFALRLDEARVMYFPFAAALILLSPFLWDVCYTLVRRLIRRENVLQAHRSHLYQRMLIAGWSHGQVLALNCLLWIVCFMLAQIYAWCGIVGFIAGRWAAIAMTFSTLICYTLFVLATERASRQ